jgi:predicted nucleotidyltransferase
MIAEDEKEIILKCARKYNISYVFLFGSSVEQGQDANDIDLGVRGLEPKLFFKFYAELVKQLSKPVDLVDLSQKSLFNDLIEETGVLIYG